jgi:hypothetical protein
MFVMYITFTMLSFVKQVEPLPMIYPQRPGETVCDVCNIALFRCTIYFFMCSIYFAYLRTSGPCSHFYILQFYMKTGSCKYSQKCKFHHPISRFAPHSKENGDPQQPATLASLPRREVTC